VLDAEGVAGAGGEVDFDLVVVGEPVLAPVVDDELLVEPDADGAVGIGLELVVARRGRKELAGPAGERFSAATLLLQEREIGGALGVLELVGSVGGERSAGEPAGLAIGVEEIFRGGWR